MRTKTEKRIRVLEIERKRERDRLLKIKPHAKAIYNITNQLSIKKTKKMLKVKHLKRGIPL